MKKNLLSAGIRKALLLGSALALSQPLLAAESANPALQALFDQAAQTLFPGETPADAQALALEQARLAVNPEDVEATARRLGVERAGPATVSALKAVGLSILIEFLACLAAAATWALGLLLV